MRKVKKGSLNKLATKLAVEIYYESIFSECLSEIKAMQK